MHVGGLIFLASLGLLSPALAAPVDTASSPDDVFGDLKQAGNKSSSLGTIPSDLFVHAKFVEGRPVDRSQAQGLMLVAITALAQLSLDEVLPVRGFDVPDRYPEVHIQIGQDEQDYFTNRYAVWALYKFLAEVDQQRGDNNWVSAALAVYKRDGRGGADAIGAVYLVDRPKSVASLPITKHLDNVDGQSGIVQRDAIPATVTQGSIVQRDDKVATANGTSSKDIIPLGGTSSNDDLDTNTRFVSQQTIGQNKFFLTLFNAVFQLGEEEVFQSQRPFRLSVAELGTLFVINPPDPPRRGPPRNSKVDSIRVIGRYGAFCLALERFDESEITATIRRVVISKTSIRRL